MFFTLLFISYFFSYSYIYAIVVQCVLGIYIDQVNIGKFKNCIDKISSKIYDKTIVCDKEVKNMEIFDQLIDSV